LFPRAAGLSKPFLSPSTSGHSYVLRLSTPHLSAFLWFESKLSPFSSVSDTWSFSLDSSLPYSLRSGNYFMMPFLPLLSWTTRPPPKTLLRSSPLLPAAPLPRSSGLDIFRIALHLCSLFTGRKLAPFVLMTLFFLSYMSPPLFELFFFSCGSVRTLRSEAIVFFFRPLASLLLVLRYGKSGTSSNAFHARPTCFYFCYDG